MSISIVGQGLHFGGQVQVELKKLPAGSGIQWLVGEDDHVFFPGNLTSEHTLQAPRTTLLTKAEKSLRMPEHFLAALLGWPKADLQIRALQGELPILDGSALPWVDVLQSLFGEPCLSEFYECPLDFQFDFEHGFWHAQPAGGDYFELDLSMDQHGYRDQVHLQIKHWGDLEPILKARTYIFESDFHRARDMGMLSGATEGSGLVVSVEEGKIRVLHGGELRHFHEPCLHKVLDLCGDLALLRPQLPKLKIRIHNGGHWAHHQLLQRIQSLCP